MPETASELPTLSALFRRLALVGFLLSSLTLLASIALSEF
jgi:hypothetical protein